MTKEEIIELIRVAKEDAKTDIDEYEDSDEEHFWYLKGRFEALTVLYAKVLNEEK